MMQAPRWTEVTASTFPREREALVFLREHLPDHEPYRAWSNFEFIAGDGSINEVDALVLTPKGFFLVEIKSHQGRLVGDASTWTWERDGRRTTVDNPLLLANRKAKKLITLLRGCRALRNTRTPFLEPLVFLSGEGVQVDLPANVRASVHLRDEDAIPGAVGRPGRLGIIHALTRWPNDAPPRVRVDKPLARALSRAMEQAGIRESRRARKVSDYELDELLYEGPSYQDWSAHHVALPDDRCRVRIYVTEPGASEELRESIERAARREYQILNGIRHEGILEARAYHAHGRGPAVIFDHVAGEQRLDHFLADRGDALTVDQRLDILRQVAEALRYAHEKRLVHRALSPQNVLMLNPDAPALPVQVFNWQTASRAASSAGRTRLAVSATSHLTDLVEEPATVYMAPEALGERGEADRQADVFSLGALAWRLFSGQPPAATFIELTEKVRTGRGLRISDVLDGAPESLADLIRFATHPEVTQRTDSVDDFLQDLEKYEDELTAPEPDAALVEDPNRAKPKDRLDHGLVVKRRIGTGSTALALLVERDGREMVLKVAREPSASARIREEGDVLERLQPHQHIVRLREVLEFGLRTGLLLDRAGEQTLAERLREEGPLQLELLERFGEDLLDTVDWLEKQGIAHRDIKPDNLGVAPVGRGDALHLVLFDFSLSRTPASNILAGTRQYLDPFLPRRKPPRWDTHAERYAAAVTLYQMATNRLPTWGDGQSEPAVLDVEATLDAEAFDPALREPMLAFFARALRSDYRNRFDNAHEMLLAWRAVFAHARGPALAADQGERAAPITPLEDATPDMLLAALGLSTRALNALERTALRTVEDLLRFPFSALLRLRGVGRKTRRELAELLDALRLRFPELARAPKRVPGEVEEAAADEGELPPLEVLAARLLPARPSPGGADDVVRRFLDLDGEGAPGSSWPSQSDVARAVGVHRTTESQALSRARTRWLKIPAITRVRHELVELLESQDGVMTSRELADALIAHHGSDRDEPQQLRAGLAVVRAALESELERASRRCSVRRARGGHCILVARDELDESGEPHIDGEKLADYAERLGERADRVAAQDPLPAPTRALEALQQVPVPAGIAPLPANRLLQLATATARGAALSSRLEIYPRGMPARRALKLSLNALSGAPQFSEAQIHERVAGRYPEAEPLPSGESLATLLGEVGSALTWQPEARDGRGVYLVPHRDFTTVSSGTAYARSTSLAPAFDAVPEEAAELERFEARLEHALDGGEFLVLATPPAGIAKARAALTARFPVAERSLEEILIRHMKAVVRELGADWKVVLAADAVPAAKRRASTDWQNLTRVVSRALPRVDEEICASAAPLLLTWPGLLARYDRLGYIGELREKTGREGGPPALWLLVPSDAQAVQPTIDGQPVPVFATTQWARIPESWLRRQRRRAHEEAKA